MKNRKIMKTILSCLYAIPFLSIGSAVLINTFNENSYLTTNEDIEYSSLETSSDIVFGNTYYLMQNKVSSNTSTQYSMLLVLEDFEVINGPQEVKDFANQVNKLQLYRTANQNSGQITTYFMHNDTNLKGITYNAEISFIFKCKISSLTTNNYNAFSGFINRKQFNESFLNFNTFDYGIDRFNDLGFDKMGFMQYFTDLFVTTPNRYTTFINSYFNYFLLVTCVSVLPRVLYWFIEWSVSFTEKFVRKDN